VDILRIPGSSVSITRLGFGCARLFDGREFAHSAALLETAMRNGIRHFDTAPSYGSEDVLGTVLGGTREATITTKVGIARFRGEQSTLRRYFGPLYRATLRPLLARTPAVKSRLQRLVTKPPSENRVIQKRRLSRDEVLRELDESLRRLRRAAVDVYLLHEPEAIEITDELAELFVGLQRDGVIGAFGLAWGARESDSVSFGSVVQSRLPDAQTSEPGRRAPAHIYHGVVRFGQRNPPDGTAHPPAAALIRAALQRHRDGAVIFSASTPAQIREICIDSRR
jgi:aryl-alcohol dehydrogenase-like predicted oxidoreductase